MPFDAISRNSRRLFDEALNAINEKRFATATAMAIFSIEEAAKYVICKRENKWPDIPKKRVYRHNVKHEEMGEYFWYWAIYSVLSDTFKDFKSFAEEMPEADPKALELIGSLSGGDAVDYIRFRMFSNEDEMRSYVKERFEHPELLDISEAGASGAVELLRRKCLYVDLTGERDEVTSSPEDITEDEAKKWLEIAWFGQQYIKITK